MLTKKDDGIAIGASGPRADDEAAPYLAKALFLAQTMSAPHGAALLQAKRERVFEQVSHTTDPHVKVDFGGMALVYALLAIADWYGTLPTRHRMSENVISGARSALAAKFGTRREATIALIALLRPHAPFEDPVRTERDLRDEATMRRYEEYRNRREIWAP